MGEAEGAFMVPATGSQPGKKSFPALEVFKRRAADVGRGWACLAAIPDAAVKTGSQKTCEKTGQRREEGLWRCLLRARHLLGLPDLCSPQNNRTEKVGNLIFG